LIIDFHAHTFPDKLAPSTIQLLSEKGHIHPFTNGTVGGLAASMRKAGVDRSVVLPVATNTRQVPRVNDASARLCETGVADGILSFGCMHPDYPDWKEELARIAALGLKGIKLHPVYQDIDFDDPRTLRILERAAEVGLVVITHAGLDVGFPGKTNCSPDKVLRAVQAVGPMKLVLAHMGGWRNWDQVEELLVDTGVYLDTSVSLGELVPNGDGVFGPADLKLMADEQFLRMVRSFGPHRFLFATDSPWGGQAEELAKLRALPLIVEEQEAILGGNAMRLLNLS